MAEKLSGEDEALVRRAMGKELVGEALTGAESRALRRWEKLERERVAWEVYAAVPKKHYREMSGRQDKVINQQAERYGLSALLGPTVDLRRLLPQLHDFLAKHWHRFEEEIEADSIMTGGAANSPAMERYRQFKGDLASLEVEERQGSLLPRAEVREGLLVIAGVIRTAGEHLEREYGVGARAVLDGALDDAEAKIRRLVAAGSENGPDLKPHRTAENAEK